MKGNKPKEEKQKTKSNLMPHPYHTERLILRPFKEIDFPYMRSLHMNEKVMKHIGNGMPRTAEQSQIAMERSLQIEQEDERLGSWIVELKYEKTKIGILIIRHPATKESIDGIEIGYSFHPDHWGKEYAQETAKAMVEYTYLHFGPIRMIGLVDPINKPSKQVLIKTGFVSIGMTEYVDPASRNIIATEILEIPKLT